MSVDLRDIVRRHANTPALDGVSLRVEDAGLLALLGPSGSGKTTLLRVIAGLDRPDSGRVAIDGRDMADVPARSRGVGFVFQHYALFRHMTVAGNIGFGLRLRRIDRATVRRRVGELLDLVQMPELAHRYPDQLSGGQRQRVALARALAIEPRVLLLDEPFGALDAQVRKDLRRWLREMHERVRLTTVFVTHDQSDALELADQVAVLRAGRLQQLGTPAELLESPANAFVFGFVGDALRLPCMVTNGHAVLDGLTHTPFPADCPPGRAVAMIRPHEVGVGPLGDSGDVPAIVRDARQVGPLWHLKIALGSRDTTMEILAPVGVALPPSGAACGLDLSRARVYPATSVNAS